MLYRVTVTKIADYEISADSVEEALDIADEWLNETEADVKFWDEDWKKEIEVN